MRVILQEVILRESNSKYSILVSIYWVSVCQVLCQVLRFSWSPVSNLLRQVRGGGHSKMAVYKNPYLTFTHGHTKSTARYGVSPTEKELKSRCTASSIRDERATSRHVGEVETWSYQSHTPTMETHNWEGSHRPRTSPWGVRVLCLTTGTPTIGTCTRETRPQNIWFWKTTGLISRDPGSCEDLNTSFKGLVHGLTCPRNQSTGSSLRGDWIICEGNSVAKLKASARGVGISWDFPQGCRHWRVPLFALSLCSDRAGGCMQI